MVNRSGSVITVVIQLKHMANSDDKWERLKKLNHGPTSEPTSSPSSNLRLLAIGYNVLVYSIIVFVVLMILLIFTVDGSVEFKDRLGTFWGALWVASWVSWATVLVGIVIVCAAIGDVLSTVMHMIGFLIPCVNLFVMFSVYSNAKVELAARGVKTGFFGVDLREVR